ncbi:RNA polymerase sigma-70 factor (ECF subfamily) [Rhodococcus sp. 27YEA15]|uniref:RNA polymerase sigma factor n=1 Tax=Rhodococcus sp. 27YEA15 TaxID=3156259 RepID=UPI003C7CED14
MASPRPQGLTGASTPGGTTGGEAGLDQRIVDAAMLDDREAFEAVVHHYGPALHRYARRMLADEGDILEVVQDTFVAAWRRLDSFRGESSIQTWLFSICSRKIIDTYRIKRAQPIDDKLLDPLIPSQEAGPFDTTSNVAFLEALEEALGELPYRQRAAWILREVEMLTFVQVGEILRLSADSVRAHHHRARANLGERMMRWR